MSALARLFDILPWRKQKEIHEELERGWAEIRKAWGDLFRAILGKYKTDSKTGWNRLHEKVKFETLRFFNIGWIHWRWILGNNRSCLK